MELSEIREKIDAVDEQLLDLFLQRMDLSDEVAAYKNAHHLPILNKERERAILAKVTEKSGERERYAYHLFSTLFELARSRQAELISAPTKVAAQVRASLEAGTSVFPQTGLVACQGVEGANSQVACDRLLPRGNIVYVKTFQAVVSAVESGLCRFGVLPIENSSNGSVRAVYELLQDHNLSIVRSTRLCIRHELLTLPGVKMEDAYKARYFDDIMARKTAETAKKTESGVVERIRQRGARPSENGTNPGGAAVLKTDVSKLTPAQCEELERRAMRGQIITF